MVFDCEEPVLDIRSIRIVLTTPKLYVKWTYGFQIYKTAKKKTFFLFTYPGTVNTLVS